MIIQLKILLQRVRKLRSDGTTLFLKESESHGKGGDENFHYSQTYMFEDATFPLMLRLSPLNFTASAMPLRSHMLVCFICEWSTQLVKFMYLL